MARKRKIKQSEGSPERALKRQAVETSLPEGVHHYQELEEVPYDLQKYWHQGYSIFSKYDEGIWMTDDAWFGVTHECIAQKIAKHMDMALPEDRVVVLDPFCGVGGNTIALALSGRWKRVYAIEKDPATLACARHNAEVYGVADKITWFEGDCFEVMGLANEEWKDKAIAKLIKKHGVVFASPPWGGPSYQNAEVFDTETMEPYSLSDLYDSFSRISDYIALYLPRTSDLNQIAQKVDRNKTQVVHYCTNGASRALCAYFGDWATIE